MKTSSWFPGSCYRPESKYCGSSMRIKVAQLLYAHVLNVVLSSVFSAEVMAKLRFRKFLSYVKKLNLIETIYWCKFEFTVCASTVRRHLLCADGRRSVCQTTNILKKRRQWLYREPLAVWDTAQLPSWSWCYQTQQLYVCPALRNWCHPAEQRPKPSHLTCFSCLQHF